MKNNSFFLSFGCEFFILKHEQVTVRLELKKIYHNLSIHILT